MTGNSATRGKYTSIAVRKTFLAPKRSISLATKRTWNKPSTMPNAPRDMPMVDGGSPNPPISIGVA